MATVLVFVIPIAILWALVVFPSFRLVAAIFCGIIGIVWMVLSGMNDAEIKKTEKEKAEKAASNAILQGKQREQQKLLWSKVSPDRVEIRDVALKAPTYGDRYDFRASIKNLSGVKLGGFQIEITAFDCVAKNSCEVIGKSIETTWADIPPQQVRGINTTVELSNVPTLRGTLAVTARALRVSTGDILASFERDFEVAPPN